MNIVILGAGRVGRAMAIDLAKDPKFRVTVADRDVRSLQALKSSHRIAGEEADLSAAKSVQRVVAGAELVVSAVPGFMGFRTLEAVLAAGKNVVDIAFFPEDPFELDALARSRKVTAVVDCGVAPGMSNLLVARGASLLDRVERVRILVGGLPTVRRWPYEYQAGFSPVDVIEEYTRPSRIVRGGKVEVVPALSEIELVDVPGLGTLEAFVTDGLRTLVRSIDAPDMIEKTMRYPGHAEKMRMLRESGFFSDTPVDIDGARVRPIDVATRLLFPMWQMHEGDEDVTVMRILVGGTTKEEPTEVAYDLIDRFDRATATSAMARSTGYTATTAVRLLAAGLWAEPGIVPPERLGQSAKCTEFMLAGLRERGIVYRSSADPLAVSSA